MTRIFIERTQARRRQDDIEFLERLRTANIEELERMQEDHRKGPIWKQIAIARAISRAKK